MEQLTGVCTRRQQWVKPQDLGIAVGGAGLLLARDLADGRVHVDDETGRQGHGAPCAPHLADDRLELADVTEGERPQEGAQGRRRHDPVREDRFGRTGAQHVSVVDVSGAGDHGVDDGEHLASR